MRKWMMKVIFSYYTFSHLIKSLGLTVFFVIVNMYVSIIVNNYC